MPVGPSHGSRGGGGHSHSGGSRHSNSHSSGSSLGGAIVGGLIYSMFADRRRRRFHNHYGYDPTPDEINSMPRRSSPTKYLVFAIVLAIFSAFTMLIRVGYSNNVKSLQNTIEIMETDYTDYYKPLFEKATAEGTDGYYKTIATFTNSSGRVNVFTSYSDNPITPGAYLDFVKDNVSYYFIVYKYVDHNGKTCRGTTYTQFSANQYQNLNGEIEIAYYSKDGAETYSMNTSYNISDCAEYNYYKDLSDSYKKSANTTLTVFIVEILFVALFVVLFISKLKKYRKLVAEDEELLFKKRQAETEKAQAEAKEAQYDAQRKNRFCQYCGSQIDPNTNTCTSCGARVSE